MLGALTVSVLSAIVAASGVIATAGGEDQRLFHWVTVAHFREDFPSIDIADVQTATAPLYHLIVAAASGVLGLSEGGAQFIGSLFAAALAAVVLWFAGTVVTGWRRILVTLPLLLSPYFWQSALWMMNDAAALLFAFLAFVAALRLTGSARGQLITGLLLAAAVATRQTYVWAVVPVVGLMLLQTQGRPMAVRAAAVARATAPALVVVAILVAAWQGFIPPPFREINAATRSWVSLSYCLAVAAVFLGPVLIATSWRRRAAPRVATCVAIAATVPALVFTSAATVAPNDMRRGGIIWSAVAHGPVVMDRSLVLAALAALGAWVICQLVSQLPLQVGVLWTGGVGALAITMCAGGQLYQKYFELPIAALTVILVCALIAAGRLARYWPLALLSVVQLVLTAGIVVKPFVTGLVS